MARKLLGFLVAVLPLVFPAVAGATSWASMTLDQVQREASLVVVGTVGIPGDSYEEGDLVYTDFPLRVSRVLSGEVEVGSVLQIKALGGATVNKAVIGYSVGQPDEQVLVFLKAEDTKFAPVGGPNGIRYFDQNGQIVGRDADEMARLQQMLSADNGTPGGEAPTETGAAGPSTGATRAVWIGAGIFGSLLAAAGIRRLRPSIR